MSDNPFGNADSDSPAPEATGASTPMNDVKTASGRLGALKAKEAELLARQRAIQESQGNLVAAPNWPPFYPVIVYAPERDIPEHARSCVRHSLYGVIGVHASAMLNLLVVMCVWGLPTFRHIRCIVLAVIQGLGTGYVALNYGYIKLYNAAKERDIPFSWVSAQFMTLGWCIYLAVGFPDSGFVGFATLLDILAKSDYKFSAFMALLNTVGIGATTYFQARALYKAQEYQKVSGHDQQPLNSGETLVQ